MNLPWTYEIKAEPEGGWFIKVKELDGCMSQGVTLIHAYSMIRDAMIGWLESELEANAYVPEPDEDALYHVPWLPTGYFSSRTRKGTKKGHLVTAYDSVSEQSFVTIMYLDEIGLWWHDGKVKRNWISVVAFAPLPKPFSLPGGET